MLASPSRVNLTNSDSAVRSAPGLDVVQVVQALVREPHMFGRHGAGTPNHARTRGQSARAYKASGDWGGRQLQNNATIERIARLAFRGIQPIALSGLLASPL